MKHSVFASMLVINIISAKQHKTIFRIGRPRTVLTAGMKCNVGGAVCGGRPIFNACGTSTRSNPFNLLNSFPAKENNRKKSEILF